MSGRIIRWSSHKKCSLQACVEPHSQSGIVDPKSLRILFVLVFAAASAPVPAQSTAAQASASREACRSAYMANCAAVPTGGEAALACLKQNAAKTSPACQQALSAAAGGNAPAPLAHASSNSNRCAEAAASKGAESPDVVARSGFGASARRT